MEGDDVMAAIQALRDYFRPDAIDRIFKQVGKKLLYKRTDQAFSSNRSHFQAIAVQKD